MRIGFIGLGKLGKDVSDVMYEMGHFIEGYDIEKIEGVRFDVVKTMRRVCDHKDIIFIAVPTPHDPLYDGSRPTSHLEPKDFDYTIVKNILDEINLYTNEKQLVVLISTVLPGTTRREFKPLIKNYRFIYNPYLIAMGTVKDDFINPEMVIIGTEFGGETQDVQLLKKFYNTIVNNNVRYEVGTWDEAESIKIFYNTFISAKLSLVNMIQDVAEKNGNIDTDVVTGALERSDYRITGKSYMKAGMGDGGPCHPRDNIALRYMAKELGLGYDLFDSIMKSREIQAYNIAQKLVNMSQDYGLPIVIMGESYKNGVPYTDGSYSKLIGHYVQNTFNEEIKYDTIIGPAIYLLGHRNELNKFDFPKNSQILDPWRERIKNDTTYYGKENYQLNLIYDEWDEKNKIPKINGERFFPNNNFLMSDGISFFNHYGLEIGDDVFPVKKCKMSAIKKNPNKKFYYILNYHTPISEVINRGVITDEIITHLKTSPNFYLMFINEHEPVNEIDFIDLLNFLNQNNINHSKIYTVCNNSNLNEIKKKYNTSINTYKINYLLYCKIRDLKSGGGCNFETNKKGKFFMTFNKSLKPHRVALLGLLSENDLLDNFNWSFIPTSDEQINEKFLSEVLTQENLENISKFDSLEYKLSDYEIVNSSSLGIDEKRMLSQHLTEFENPITYINSYINVTTESIFEKYEGTIHISEKSFKPFFYYQFPIMVASQGHIKKMKELYDLDFFDDVIDHSYDNEPDAKKRLLMIVDEIKRLNNNREGLIHFYNYNQVRFQNNKIKIIGLLKYIQEDYLFFKNLI